MGTGRQKSLEQQLMKGEPAPEKPATPEEPAKDAAPGPQSWFRFDFGPKAAYAQGVSEQSAELADKLRSNPDVVAAYKEMGDRLGYIDRLREQGTVGEGSDGLLAPRGDMGKKESAAMAEENKNRTAIIRAMAVAIVELNGQPVNDANVGQVLSKAAAQFAAVRADAAKPGWWVQGADGAWGKK
ncbi:MAG: DUF1318 domain-containing protein [Nitrospirae bacterium]|nr:DUF1318 domain-containing protein [Nitrospirota bacterium]